ncbi:MAG: ABC transporter substrate-binding protein [Bacteroidales bacterium]|nr:ABC transporter substrate-binding protein [Bacteroidales bacterium]
MTYKNGLLPILFLSIFFSFSCKSSFQENKISAGEELKLPDYAIGFSVLCKGNLRQLSIHSPWNNGSNLNVYYLWPDSLPIPDSLRLETVILTPVRNIVALSATQWGPLLKLGMDSIIKGVSESRFIQNETIKNMLKSGALIDVAADGVYKMEQLVKLEPDLVLYSPDPMGISSSLQRSGIKLLAWPDYFETNPLGRAEWIKVLGLLVQKEVKANQIFDSIALSYNHLKALTKTVAEKPQIFADKAFAGQWYVPGGKSYMAEIFKDAGANYVFSDNNENASFPLDIETILAKSKNAEYWRIAQAADFEYSYEDLARENELYRAFEAFKNKRIIFCNTAKTAYFEQSPMEPHILLADFIAILHPDLLPGHIPVYHTLLR